MSLIKKTKRESVFIKGPEGKMYLPRPTGWLSGWMRHRWFQDKTGVTPSIASPDYWNSLRETYVTSRLVEYEDGQWEITSESR